MKFFKQTVIIILTLSMIFAMPVCVSAAPQKTIQTEEELIEYLEEQKGDTKGNVSVEFACDKDLYSSLEADNFKNLCKLLYKANINGAAARISYRDSDCTIKLSYQFSKNPIYECATAADLESVFETIAKEKPKSASFVFSPSLYQTLTKSKNMLYYAAAKEGIKDLYARTYDNLQVIEASDFELLDGPYAYVEDYAQFASAISHFEKQKLKEFDIAFSADLFDKITNDKAERNIMVASSTLDSYGYMSKGRGGILNFYSVSYTDVVRSICREKEDLAGIISRMGAAGIKDFEIIFPYPDDFKELFDNNCEKLIEIETEAGMKSRDLSYSMSYDRISYTNASIVSDAVALNSLSDAISYTEKMASSGEKEINLFCTETLYKDLLGDLASKFTVVHDGMTRIYDLVSQAGICDYEMASSPAAHVITITIKDYFPGTKIMLAEKSGDQSRLSDKEKKTLEAAKEVAKEAKNKDPLLTAKYIHDWLCEKNEYTDDEDSDEDDTAIGAILNGKANCDGYTDAFYLIGSLAGLNIRYQHGDSLEKNRMVSLTPVTHIWNLLEVDDEWRMVDVTWDDNGNAPIYVWFNVGNDVASRMHTWNEDMTVELAKTTKRENYSEKEFYADDSSDVKEFLKKMNEQKTDFFLIVDTKHTEDELLQIVKEELDSNRYTYSWNEKMGMLTVQDLEW